MINKVLKDVRGRGVMAYMDDIVIYTRNIKEHDIMLRKVFSLLKEAKLRVNSKKILLGLKQVKLLGVTVDGEDQVPSETKRNEALEYTRPETITELRRFIGLAGWFRAFIPKFAEITAPLAEATKGGETRIEWATERDNTFVDTRRY